MYLDVSVAIFIKHKDLSVLIKTKLSLRTGTCPIMECTRKHSNSQKKCTD